MNKQYDASISSNRQSNIELLRIITMILIIAHHFSVHGGFDFSTSEVTINRIWIQFIQIGGKIGVNIFVLISGYFLINSKSIKINKILKMWLHIFMYSILSIIIFVAAKIEPFNVKETIKHIFPITFSHWWFASTYFVLYLISPYLNKFLKSLDKHTYQNLIILSTICWCLIPTFLTSYYQSNNLIWFMYLYSLAAYIKLHITNINIPSKHWIITSLILTFLTFLSTVVLDLIGRKVAFAGTHATFLYGRQKFPILIISLFTFIGFLKINIRHKRIINTMAAATFGVYLIHDDNYVRKFLWKRVFKNAVFSDSAFLIPYSIVVIIIVYFICIFIELLRINILEKHYIKIIDIISQYIKRCIVYWERCVACKDRQVVK